MARTARRPCRREPSVPAPPAQAARTRVPHDRGGGGVGRCLLNRPMTAERKRRSDSLRECDVMGAGPGRRRRAVSAAAGHGAERADAEPAAAGPQGSWCCPLQEHLGHLKGAQAHLRPGPKPRMGSKMRNCLLLWWAVLTWRESLFGLTPPGLPAFPMPRPLTRSSSHLRIISFTGADPR